MTAIGLLTTLMAWGISWAIGVATSRLLFTRRSALVEGAAPLPLGLATTCCWLEGAGFFLPIRIAAFPLLIPAAFGLWMMVRARRFARSPWERATMGMSLFALAVGLYPVVVAGRFTSAALTNNDSTYYLTAADRLLRLPWRIEYDPIPVSQCLTERMFHTWNWRLGTPNLMAAVCAMSGLSPGASLAIVTALLFACLPAVAISIARGTGALTGRPRRALVVGLLATCSAAPLFTGYQHMTGNLAACSLFPLSLAATLSAVRSGGVRRSVYAALLFGAGIAFYADGAATLLVVAMAVFLANLRRPLRAAGRLAMIAGATLAVAPFTVSRVVHTALKVMRASIRASRNNVKLSELVFPQRGWLPRSVVDDLTTLTGVDPWPPWPAASPPNLQTVVTWAATFSGLVLLGLGLKRLSRRDERIAFVVLGVTTVVALRVVAVFYLRGKVLLMAAAFATPVSALAAESSLRRPIVRWLAVMLGAGEVVALSQLVVPARWKVIDSPAHDALVRELARVPPGSLLALDGLGAPTDPVLDSHRAYRAALLADLIPVQPGLDGGFYVPEQCPPTERPDPLPERAYALQRITSETLTHGDVIAAWDGFRLVEAELRSPAGFVAAWAPTHGFMAAEHEPDGRVFRWAEWTAKGTLQAMTEAPCARLEGALRVLGGTARVEISVDGRLAYLDEVTADWKRFETRPFSTEKPSSIELTTTRLTGLPPDAAHALAMSRLSLRPETSCGPVVRLGRDGALLELRGEIRGDVELSVAPPDIAPCAALKLVISANRSSTLKITVDGARPVLSYVGPPSATIVVPLGPSGGPHRVTIGSIGGAPDSLLQIADAAVLLRQCR